MSGPWLEEMALSPPPDPAGPPAERGRGRGRSRPEAASQAPLRVVCCEAKVLGGRGAAGPWSSECNPGAGVRTADR